MIHRRVHSGSSQGRAAVRVRGGEGGTLGGIKPNVGIPNFGPFLDASQCLFPEEQSQ